MDTPVSKILVAHRISSFHHVIHACFKYTLMGCQALHPFTKQRKLSHLGHKSDIVGVSKNAEEDEFSVRDRSSNDSLIYVQSHAYIT